MLQKYDFVTGIETASAPQALPPSGIGGIPILGVTTDFTIANNTGPANITGMIFDKTQIRMFTISYSVYRSASGGQTRAESGLMFAVTDGTNWTINALRSGVPAGPSFAGMTFSITSAGQVQYTSDDNGGSYSAATSIMKWSIFQLTGV